MGLKSTVKPGPIVVQPESKDTTPSVTPMRPTPLVGKWCDLPWSEEQMFGNHQVTPKSKIGSTALFLSEASAPVALHGGDGLKKPAAVVTLVEDEEDSALFSSVPKKELDALALALCRPIPSDEGLDLTTTPPPKERAATAEPPSSDDGMEDLYLATPMDTFTSEDFETDAPPQAPHSNEAPPCQNFRPEHQPQVPNAYQAYQLPPNAAHFVDFRRLHAPVAQQPQYPSSVTTYHTPSYPVADLTAACGYPLQSLPQPSIIIGAQATQATMLSAPAPVRARQGVVVLISRFPPPPPPTRASMNTMLRTGSSFDAYYQIIMRWYARVARSVPKAHPNVPPCPRAEDYLADFDGWVGVIEQWWHEHFARRQRGGPSKKRAN